MLVVKLVSSSGVELTQRYKHGIEAINKCQRVHCLIADRPVVIDGRRFVLRWKRLYVYLMYVLWTSELKED